LTLYEPGEYQLKLSYYGNQETVAKWTVHEPAKKRCAKNVILFIGDGMPQSAITAARLIGHKQVNGKYQSKMQLDDMDHVGLQMTHSIDRSVSPRSMVQKETSQLTFGVAASSPTQPTLLRLCTPVTRPPSMLYPSTLTLPLTVCTVMPVRDRNLRSNVTALDDPRVETIAELFQNQIGGPVGIVSTAFVADATPITLAGHTRDRDLYAPLIAQMLNGQTNLSWVDWKGPGKLSLPFFDGLKIDMRTQMCSSVVAPNNSSLVQDRLTEPTTMMPLPPRDTRS
jgi:hypothetical protein